MSVEITRYCKDLVNIVFLYFKRLRKVEEMIIRNVKYKYRTKNNKKKSRKRSQGGVSSIANKGHGTQQLRHHLEFLHLLGKCLGSSSNSAPGSSCPPMWSLGWSGDG